MKTKTPTKTSNKFKETLENLLKKDSRLIDENKELNLAAIRDLADKTDNELIKLLLSNAEATKKFFLNVDNVLVFKQNDFKFFLDANQIENSYTAYENRIGLATGSRFLKDNDDVVVNFPYKDCVLEGGQSSEDGTDEYFEYNEDTKSYKISQAKRKEIFFNDILAKDEIDRLEDSKALVNWKRYTADGKEKVKILKRDRDGTIRENLIIKGNNLLTLHSLKEQFAGKVKLIYIDPPYNTGDDSFGYNDNFNHSSWMTFIKNRLIIARQLLAKEGSIFIQINDIEEAYLKVLCDEVFTRENFHTSICVQMSHLSGVKMAHKEKKLPKIKEYILFYTNSEKIKLNPQYVAASWNEALERYTSFVVKGKYSDEECSKWEIVPLNKAIKDAGVDIKNIKAVLDFKLKNADLIFRTARNRGADYSSYDPNVFTKITNPDESYYFSFKGEDVSFAADKVININGKLTPVVSVGDIWTDIGINNLSNEGGVDLRFGKKPEKLIERIIKIITNSDKDIVMDFFSGSGTTGAVAHKLKRQYILVEQLDDHIKKSVDRLTNVIKGEQGGVSKDNNWQGGGDFIYIELAKWNEEAKDKILQCNSLRELEKLLNELSEKYFLHYNVKFKEFKDKVIHEGNFLKLSLKKQKDMFCKMLDLNQLYINASEMEDKIYGLSKDDIALTKNFYNL